MVEVVRMKNNLIDVNRPIFVGIKEAVRITGLSEFYFRQGLMPRLKAQLEQLTDCAVEDNQ